MQQSSRKIINPIQPELLAVASPAIRGTGSRPVLLKLWFFSYSYTYCITTQRLVAWKLSSALCSYRQHEQQSVCSELYCVNTISTAVNYGTVNTQQIEQKLYKHVLNNTCCLSSETHACTCSCSFFILPVVRSHTLKRRTERKPARQVLIIMSIVGIIAVLAEVCYRSLWHYCT